MVKNLSVTQYAKQQNISRQAVLKKIKTNRNLPGIQSVEMVGKTYILRLQQGYKNKSCQSVAVVK